MSTIDHVSDLQLSLPPPRRRRRRRPPRRRRPLHTFPPIHPITTTTPTTTIAYNSSSDAPSSTRHDSSFAGGDEFESSGIRSYNHTRRMESSSDEIDLESGELEMKVHSKQCRICHLNFEIDDVAAEEEDDDDVVVDVDGDGKGGGAIELGCNCKGDLGTAHKQCAETWFKIKGNLTCEICGATAQNVGSDQTNETNTTTTENEPADRSAAAPMVLLSEQRTFWQGRRIMNILLGCMVFAFIISWLFHFNVLP